MGAAHCWKGYAEWVCEHYGVKHWWEAPDEAKALIIGDGDLNTGFNDATCLLPDGHEGPHEWTPDNEIIIRFPAEAST